MHPIRLLFALAAVSLIGAAKTPLKTVDYTVAPVVRDGALAALDVTTRFRAGPSGFTRLTLPDKQASASNLHRYFKDIAVEGAQDVREDGPAARVIRSKPYAPLTLRYRVVSAFDHAPTPDDADPYKPTILPRWFWIYGEALFITPVQDGLQASFTWTGPKDLPFASDLEHAAGKPMPMDDLQESVLIGGPELTVFTRKMAGAPVRVAVIGAYSRFTAEAFVDMTARIIAGERQFWHAHEGPFLVALSPVTPQTGRQSSRGEGRGDAFAVMTTSDIRLDRLKSLLAHEYFHTWNPARLGRMYPDPEEPAAYWFSEGFTDFYARRLLLKMGEFSLEAFAQDWNDTLSAYASSPAYASPGRRVVEAFWTDRYVQKLPYQRGAILAALWNHRLLEQSHGRTSLDDVMRAMQVEARRAGEKGPKSPDLFIATARKFGLDVRPEVAAVIEKGGPALLPDGAFGDCLAIKNETAFTYDPGLDIKASRANRGRLVGVEPGGPAERAGLRDGMQIISLETYADPSKPMTFTVKGDDGKPVNVTYLPQGKDTVVRQRLEVPSNLPPERRAVCAHDATFGKIRLGSWTRAPSLAGTNRGRPEYPASVFD